jgi:hypothetical protein
LTSEQVEMLKNLLKSFEDSGDVANGSESVWCRRKSNTNHLSS